MSFCIYPLRMEGFFIGGKVAICALWAKLCSNRKEMCYTEPHLEDNRSVQSNASRFGGS